MNVEEYISSGILEAYVMDQLSEAERSEVESAATQHPEIKDEIEKIEISLENLAFASAIEPPQEIKSSLLEKISRPEKETPVVPMPAKKGYGFLKLAAAASITLALISSIIAFNYWSKWQSTETRLSDLITQNQQFAENYNQVNQQLDDIQQAVGIMNSNAYKRVVMNGTDNSPNALATVYWNESSEDVYLSIQNLKELSEDQQYQLWAIIDGKPVDAGVFDPDSPGFLVLMKKIGANAAAFAVTIEPRGGSEDPSLETMQVVGNV